MFKTSIWTLVNINFLKRIEQIFITKSTISNYCDTGKPRFWNTSWSVAKNFLNHRPKYRGWNIHRPPQTTIKANNLCHKIFGQQQNLFQNQLFHNRGLTVLNISSNKKCMRIVSKIPCFRL